MRAMVFREVGQPLQATDVAKPEPQAGEVRLRVTACGLCRTDLHVVDGDLPDPRLPLIPGHQVVGTVDALGDDVEDLAVGDRVGVPWLGSSCGACFFCRSDQENLCDQARYTGYQINGGFAEYCTADARFCFPISADYPDTQAAPLLCAGLIGYRSLRKCDDAKRLGFYGFGSAAHILIQVCRHFDQEVYAFTRPGDEEGQAFARDLAAVWAGDSETMPPEPLDAAIIFAPVGDLVPQALRAVRKAGIVVCAGIHMSQIPSFPYKILWEERQLRSVANLTRADGEAFLNLAPQIPVKTTVHTYALDQVNQALDDLRHGRFSGSAVIVP